MKHWPSSAPSTTPSTATRPAASWPPGTSVRRGLRHQLNAEWQPLVACVSRLTFEKDTRSGLWPSREEIGCYACQIRLDARTLAHAVRSHWGIENQDHYVRDVTLGEDDSRIRQKPGGMARIRSAALNILRANGVQNVSQALYINALIRPAARARLLMTSTEWPWASPSSLRNSRQDSS
jgi:predicted transposase YbfD/YdcC